MPPALACPSRKGVKRVLEFYTWPAGARLFITFFFAVCVLFQTASLVLSRSRFPKTRAHYCESVLELAVLAHILCLSLMHGRVVMGIEEGSAPPSGYGALRIAVFCCVAAFAALAAAVGRRGWPLLTVLAALALLPAVEAALGRAYPWAYLLSLAFLLLRSVHLSLLRYRETKTGLSALSVKEAIDNLPTGIMFCRGDGRILLESRRMQQLMAAIAGETLRSGLLFYERLLSGAYDDACERAELDSQVVCLLADKTAWMFTKTDIEIKGRPYIQLTASDVTERYRLTAELREQDMALKKRSEELRRTIANLHNLSRERELGRAKMRAHDVLGQRLTVLLGMTRGDQALDVPLLKSLSAGLLQQLGERPGEPAPDEELMGLRRIFGSIGVDVRFNGRLPDDDAQARLFVDAIRESVANAVRHGFATEVEASSFKEGGDWRLCIRNNGHAPAQPIVEGGGIGGMREKLASSGGTLTVTPVPQFALSVTLPGGGA